MNSTQRNDTVNFAARCACCFGATLACSGPPCHACSRLSDAVKILDGLRETAQREIDRLISEHVQLHDRERVAIEADLWAEPLLTNDELVARCRALRSRIERRWAA